MASVRDKTLYRLFGLTVSSNLPLGGPTADDPEGVSPDVDVTFTEADVPLTQSPDPVSVQWYQHNGSYRLRYTTTEGHTLSFAFAGEARRLQVHSSSPGAAHSIASVFLGPAMAAALHLRGTLVLHGAAVASEGRALLVLGPSGAGKSTLAASLIASGASLLSEEVIALDRVGNTEWMVRAGHPRISLGRRTLEMLGLTGEDLKLVRPEQPLSDKRWVDADCLGGGGWRGVPAQLGTIWLLGGRHADDDVRIRPIPPTRATVELLRQTYGAGWLTPPSAPLLDACSALAAAVPVHVVTMPDQLDRVKDVSQVLLAAQRAGSERDRKAPR